MPQPRPDAVQQAVSLLARREHSSRELRDKLRARSYSPEAVEAALTTLREQNLQSDQRFAEACVRSLMERGYGSLRIAGELRSRGVSSDIAREFEHLAQEGDLERAGTALSQKTKARVLERAQMLRFLGQRGYPGDIARRAVEAVLQGEAG